MSDADLLIGLLELERRLVALYAAGRDRRLLPKATAQLLHEQESEHARGLQRALAGMGVTVPQGVATAPDLLRPDDFLAEALRLEDEAVAAYVDALAALRNPRLAQPLGSIAASEGQHQVILRLLNGTSGVA